MTSFEELRSYLGTALARLDRQAGHLRRSLSKVESHDLSDPLERLDQFEALSARFARLQDLLVGPFRTVAMLEFEEQAAARIPDLLNLMEKRQIIESAAEWGKMRELRNAIAHGYWENEQERDELFGLVTAYSHRLLRVLDRLCRYAREHRLL